jgi:signal transduction histidine kinase
MLATVFVLLRFSRQVHRLAELQMNFVAGVSHELRTPLTVIRTAAFNLKGRVAGNPAQVERYGSLIQKESEKLTALVEQVLQFANTRAGRVIRKREPVAVESVIEQGLQSSRAALESHRCTVEKQVAPGLPLVLADSVALQHAIQNLLDNAVKYGSEGSNWIGISAAGVPDESGLAVEIRVADRGPGIPRDEQEHIFDAFYRGRRAVEDQIHGTGLGLNLVKKIIEAHGGTIRVKSEPMQGAEFIVRIPAAPPEQQDEFAHSFG